MAQWRVEFYQDQRGRRPVEDWLLTLEVKDRARVRRAFGLLESYGTRLTMPYARHLRGKLWELRVAAGRQDYRVLYAAAAGRRFILLHGFTKQTAKTPARELEIAEQRWADYQAQHAEGE
jgi:phage-related protein